MPSVSQAWRQDNQGPHAGPEALAIFHGVQAAFPNATVHGSDAFDDFVLAIEPYISTLPVVTAEIGDSWIHGASADLKKVAMFRAIARARATCLAAGCDPAPGSAALAAFDRLVIKAGEHTWGWDGEKIKSAAWSNPELEAALARGGANSSYFNSAVYTWLEQRAFLTNAVAALPTGSSLRTAVDTELAALEPRPLGGVARAWADVQRDAELDQTFGPFTVGRRGDSGGSLGLLGFDGTGAITLLRGPSGVHWASANNTVGRVWYMGMDAGYFTNFTAQYLRGYNGNFDKPGLNLTAISTNMSVFRFQNASMLHGTDNTAHDAGDVAFIITMAPADLAAHTARGAPGIVEVLIEAGIRDVRDRAVLQLNFTVQWWNKTATHAPETIWLSLLPKASDRAGWTIDKLGSAVNPLDANLTSTGSAGEGGCNPDESSCGAHLHAVGPAGATYVDTFGRATARSIDTALLSVGSANPVPTPQSAPDPRGGDPLGTFG